MLSWLEPAFNHSEYYVYDVLRLLCMGIAMVMLGLFIRVAGKSTNTRKYGWWACVVFGVSSIGYEANQLGTSVDYHLWFNLLGVTLGCMFLWKSHPEEW